MMDTLAWIEQTGLSTWVREDFYAYFILLIFHAWGMALLVGCGMAIQLRVLGIARQTQLSRWAGLFPWMKLGALLAIISGMGLLAGYPAKALTNWVFALKFVLLGGAAWLTAHVAKVSFDKGMEPVGLVKLQAVLALALWMGGVACGKLLLYTNSMLMTSDGIFEAG